MSQDTEGSAMDTANSRDQQLEAASVSPGLSPGQVAELRSWIARRGYMDQQIDLLIAASILEQGDL